ncbi:alkaline phosphatase D family protein [Derxia gummosa]|uniref:Alkaline phosphatase D family protein n=1 Tax=Derxia gummosa DSM 723 TaxID=1121388 RepID=A0A8B6X7I0_9BURK|nr:alkaline phosphatase D family protein [Derxia gummosa]
MDRRQFLRLTGFFTVSTALAGCNDEGDDNEGATLPPGNHRFAEGVASGDPRPASLVFWTRAAPVNGSADVAVTLEVATDTAFASLVASVPLTAEARYDFTVRHKLEGLSPATAYHYRFRAGGDVSATGHARTAPAATASVERLRIGVFTCQDWSVNHWQAMGLMAAEDYDFILHLGDFIYEAFRTGFQPTAAEPAHPKLSLPDGKTDDENDLTHAVSLADYRTLHRTYRGDTRLQALMAAFTAIVTWDDHEFSDDCWQDHETYTNANPQVTDRRRAATQAWAEYTPVDWGDVAFDLSNASFENIRLYRSFAFGTLATLVMTDERLYRDDHLVREADVARADGDDPVNGDDAVGSRFLVERDVLAAADAARTTALGRPPQILGSTQTQWWKDQMVQSRATWRLWGNQVALNRLWLDLPAPYNRTYVVNCDQWDGYPTHKAELLGYLADQQIGNVVALTGDLHCFQAGVVRDSNETDGRAVLVDFVTAGISSSSLFDQLGEQDRAAEFIAPLLASSELLESAVTDSNPDFAHVDFDAQGYSSVTVTPGSVQVVFTRVTKVGDDGVAPALDQAVSRRTRCTVSSGSVAVTVDDGI